MNDRPRDEFPVHGVIVAIGEAGVLIRGESGAGKSRLAQALVALGLARGQFARIVADDRVLLLARAGRVIARPPPAIAGLIEERGSGILPVVHEPRAIVRCLADLDPSAEPDGRHARLPEPDDTRDEIGGVSIARIRLDRDLAPGEAALRVLTRLARP